MSKLAYSFGALATALAYQAFAAYIIFFYVDVVKLPPYLAALGMLIYALWSTLSDPLIGYLSDHTRTRWGRRLPYIAFGALPLGVIYFLLWAPPFTALDQVFPLFLYFVFFICLFDVFYTITVLNWSALFPEMFASLKERSQVNAFRQGFNMMGLIFGIALPPLVYGRLGWGWLGVIFGSVITFMLLVALWGSREHLAFSREKQLPFLASVKATFRNRSFLTFAAANFFVQFAFTLIMAAIPFFAKYVLHEGTQGTAGLLAAAFLAALLFLYVWEKITIHAGAKRAYSAAICLLAFTLLPLFYAQSFNLTLILAFIIGFGLSGLILISDLLLADVIDEDELKTGTRREGMYLGANAFITRFAIGLEALSIGIIFSVCGYNPYVFSQPQTFFIGLRWLLAGLPFTALGIAFIIIKFYPLSGQALRREKRDVMELHLRKGVKNE
ncbi:MFS transporter [Candidatus Saganbacteria bacterium]|nr:MFS transporter [Candidatus Saganbacteria bacterium]